MKGWVVLNNIKILDWNTDTDRLTTSAEVQEFKDIAVEYVDSQLSYYGVELGTYEIEGLDQFEIGAWNNQKIVITIKGITNLVKGETSFAVVFITN